MQVDDRLGSFADVVAAAPRHGDLMGALRNLAHSLHPDGVETASALERSVSWGFAGGKMQHWYAYLRPYAAHVNLGFFQGYRLPDPAGVLMGTGVKLRHVKLRQAGEAAALALADLMIAAQAERRAALSL